MTPRQWYDHREFEDDVTAALKDLQAARQTKGRDSAEYAKALRALAELLTTCCKQGLTHRNKEASRSLEYLRGEAPHPRTPERKK